MSTQLYGKNRITKTITSPVYNRSLMIGCTRVFFYPLKFLFSVLSEVEDYRLEGQQ